MLADEGQLSDVTLHWPHKWNRLATIKATGRCPSYGVPHKARKGAVIALVDRTGRGLLTFRLARVQEGESVVGADGRRHRNGCILIAKRGTVRRPPADARFPVNRYALGAIGYFDSRRQESVFYSASRGTGSRAALNVLTVGTSPRRRHPFLANNVSKTLSQPERELLRAYADWIGSDHLFGHHYLGGPKLYTDMFIPARWALIEAKATIDRQVLRSALGQLLDYQRYYERHPRLGILVPERPTTAMIELMAAKRVTIIWQSRGGAFRDTADGAFTQGLRVSR